MFKRIFFLDKNTLIKLKFKMKYKKSSTIRYEMFEFSFLNGKKKYLTNNVFPISYENKIYSNNSGVVIESMYFDVFFKQKITLSGIWDKSGLDESDNLIDVRVKINFMNYSRSKLVCQNFVNFFCTQVINKSNKFLLVLESLSSKFNKVFTYYYSKTCRAELGDFMCKVSKKNANSYKVDSMKDEVITILNCNKPEKFYEGGFAYINDDKFLIVKHENLGIGKYDKIFRSSIELKQFVKNFRSYTMRDKKIESIYLLPKCDKSIITCKSLFNNEENFQGEPYL